MDGSSNRGRTRFHTVTSSALSSTAGSLQLSYVVHVGRPATLGYGTPRRTLSRNDVGGWIHKVVHRLCMEGAPHRPAAALVPVSRRGVTRCGNLTAVAG